MQLLAAFTIGLLGSLHCIGMCGPIALALPVPGYGVGGRLWAAVLYNVGRATTYAVLGLLFGALGQTLSLAGIQQWFSIGLGVFILLIVATPLLVSKLTRTPQFYNNAIARLKTAMQKQLQKRGFITLFTIGLLNGLLPCGFVYIGLAGATATGQWYTGAAYMALFGLGTLPLMATLVIIKTQVSLSARKTLTKLLPYGMVIMGALFIVRGLNLGIPYLSPSTTTKQVSAEYCKHDGHSVIECH
ncbi:MAG: sulfite exporter TauE/SafE family protein [Sphingobacteriales bacterium JAD_PAG50586_3]|nr:MAG: sulfite exporter TauE/SafE family protein [Sphingobacteriales bacterium JAD_PAG50586_3]